MNQPLDLSFLYYFKSPSSSMMEVRINGLEKGTPPGQVYHWLFFDHASEQIETMVFKSMGSEDGKEHRCFEQGELWFDASQARLILDGGAVPHSFEVADGDQISAEVVTRVQQHLHYAMPGLS